MGTGGGIGIGIGIGVVIGIVLAVLFGIGQGTTVLENIPIFEKDDARLAQLTATYFDDQDRLTIALILTNSDGEFTKANGNIMISIVRNVAVVYSNEYDFTKDDFLTWDNLFLGKQRGVWFTIYERFPSGNYDVVATLETKSGGIWKLQTDFRSYE